MAYTISTKGTFAETKIHFRVVFRIDYQNMFRTVIYTLTTIRAGNLKIIFRKGPRRSDGDMFLTKVFP
jgi:hypothetical protein